MHSGQLILFQEYISTIATVIDLSCHYSNVQRQASMPLIFESLKSSKWNDYFFRCFLEYIF